MENWISERDIYVRIKMNKYLTIEDKEAFDKVTRTLYMNDYGRGKLAVVKIKNQARNKIKKLNNGTE